MAQPFVTGPCHIFVGAQSGYTPLYLGTCEKSPRVEIRPHWSEVYNDIMGQSIPYDKIFEGEDAFVTIDITRWNELALASIQSRPRSGSLLRGSALPGDVGTMMKTEGWAYPLWLYWPYSAKPAYAAQPFGLRFWQTWLEGPDSLENLGTSARRTRLIFYASPALYFTGGPAGLSVTLSAGGGSSVVSATPLPNLPTQMLYDTASTSFNGLANLIN